MAHRVLDLKLLSASKLKDVNVFSRMEVYAVASVDGDRRKGQRTETDGNGTTNPKWDQDRTLSFDVPPTAAAAFGSGYCLRVLLRTERLFSFTDGDVGEVVIPLAELLAGACDFATTWHCAPYPVRKVQCSKRRGTLKLSYRFGPVVEPFVPYIGYELPPRQFYGSPHAYDAPMQQPVYPPPLPRMLPGAGLLGGGFGFGGMWFGDMPSYDAAGHGTLAADYGAVAV